MPDKSAPEVVAVFQLSQLISCPQCRRDINVIAANFQNRPVETMVITQKIYNDCERGKFKGSQDITVEVPKPYFFGALAQDTDDLHEPFECPFCSCKMTVVESRWDYSFQMTRGVNKIAQVLRRMLCWIERHHE